MGETKRVRLSRAKGYRRPEDAVVVARPTKWGNPYRWDTYRRWSGPYLPDGELDDEPTRFSDAELRRQAVVDFESMARWAIGGRGDYPTLEAIRVQLAGRDLACWCPLDQPCHADVLLELARESAPVATPAGGEER